MSLSTEFTEPPQRAVAFSVLVPNHVNGTTSSVEAELKLVVDHGRFQPTLKESELFRTAEILEDTSASLRYSYFLLIFI